MLNVTLNTIFLDAIKSSFKEFIRVGTSRSTAKLKPLHGAVAEVLQNLLGEDYVIVSLGFGEGREEELKGRYMGKKVDVVVKKAEKSVAGIAIKFVMQNYSQNSNNYFENMLGETANIRSVNIPYFQIFIILDMLPYYDKDSKIKHWEEFSQHNIDKYKILSKDMPDVFFHTPNKTLIYVIHIPLQYNNVTSKEEYITSCRKNCSNITASQKTYDKFSDGVILNDFEQFINKVAYTIKAL